jgi:hypothetical protein
MKQLLSRCKDELTPRRSSQVLTSTALIGIWANLIIEEDLHLLGQIYELMAAEGDTAPGNERERLVTSVFQLSREAHQQFKQI